LDEISNKKTGLYPVKIEIQLFRGMTWSSITHIDSSSCWCTRRLWKLHNRNLYTWTDI